MKKIFFIFIAFFISITFSCVSTKTTLAISRNLSDPGIKSEGQLYRFFISENPNIDREEIARLASLYVEEARIEGINSDCAFVQMCLETGFLRFGNLVTPDMHNYCGLGAIDSDHPGERFETAKLGVRAHIQHLHAYATNRELINECIDTRYRFVSPRAKATTIEGLSGTWAADPDYSEKLENLLQRLETF